MDISPGSATLEVTDTMQLTALAKNIRGNVIPGRSATWTTSNPLIVEVNASGMITAKRSGTATVSAQIDNITGTAQFTVEAPLHAVAVTPPSAAVEVTKTADLSVTLKDKAGNTLPGGAPISWSCENNAVATVNANGRVTAVSRGVAAIVVEVGGVRGEAEVTVESLPRSINVSPSSISLNIGELQVLAADVFDLNGDPVGGVTVQWSSDATGVATVSASGAMQAEVVGAAAGATQLRASVDNGRGGQIEASATVNVHAVVESVQVQPETVALFPGEQALLEAVLRDANQQELAGSSVTWTSADPSIASVSAAGLVAGVGVGTTQVTASAEGKSASATIEVVRWAQISARHHYSCGVLSNGAAYCWGRNSSGGVLGNGSTDSGPDANDERVGDADEVVPTPVSGGIAFASIATGVNHTCGLTPAGKAYCWGHGGAGHLGQGHNSSSPTPVAVSGTYQFVDIQVGMNHTCALDTADDVYCWGYNNEGQAGQGPSSGFSYSTPMRVLGHKFESLAVGSNHVCALSDSGATYCWGAGPNGQLGNGHSDDSKVPVQVDTSEVFVEVAAGYDFTCGRNAAGEVFCWGENDYSGLGDGTTTDQSRPVHVDASHTYEGIFAGSSTTCAIDSSHDIYCWGFNGQGNLGNGTAGTNEASRVLVSSGHAWQGISLGLMHSCALTLESGRAFCWGDNDDGQIGNAGSEAFFTVPTPVSNP